MLNYKKVWSFNVNLIAIWCLIIAILIVLAISIPLSIENESASEFASRLLVIEIFIGSFGLVMAIANIIFSIKLLKTSKTIENERVSRFLFVNAILCFFFTFIINCVVNRTLKKLWKGEYNNNELDTRKGFVTQTYASNVGFPGGANHFDSNNMGYVPGGINSHQIQEPANVTTKTTVTINNNGKVTKYTDGNIPPDILNKMNNIQNLADNLSNIDGSQNIGNIPNMPINNNSQPQIPFIPIPMQMTDKIFNQSNQQKDVVNNIEQLEKLYDLKTKGVISDSEFEDMKKSILNS